MEAYFCSDFAIVLSRVSGGFRDRCTNPLNIVISHNVIEPAAYNLFIVQNYALSDQFDRLRPNFTDLIKNYEPF